VIETLDIPDLLPRLVDRSLVSYDEVTGRYSLLETVRQYSAEHALNADESGEIRNRHFRFFERFTENARQKVRGPEQIKWLQRFDDEYDNIRLALDWGLSLEDLYNESLDMAYRMLDYWLIRSSYFEVASLVSRFESDSRSSERDNRAKILLLKISIGFFTKIQDLESSERALRLARESSDPSVRADAFAILTWNFLRQGKRKEAYEHLDETLAALRAVRDEVMSAFLHINLGNSAFIANETDLAEEHYKMCLAIRWQSKDLRGVGAALASLGYVEERRQNYGEAIRHFRRAMSAMVRVGGAWDIAGGLTTLCLELTREGRYGDAAKLVGYSDALLKSVGGERDDVDGTNYETWKAFLQDQLGSDFHAQYRIGKRMSRQAVLDLVFKDGLEVPSLEETEV
jgi:tetratricopeptide (TPR) repeat protein